MRAQQQTDQLLAIAREKAQIEAALRGTASVEARPIEPMAAPIPRQGGRRGEFPHGVVIGSDAWQASIDEKKQREAEKEAAAANKLAALWKRHKAAIKVAKARLVLLKTPSKLRVCDQTALVVDRTGHLPKEKTNKKRDGEGEGKLLQELRACLGRASLCPVTPTGDEEMDDAGDDDEELPDAPADEPVADPVADEPVADPVADDDAQDDDESDDGDAPLTCSACGTEAPRPSGARARAPRACRFCGAAFA